MLETLKLSKTLKSSRDEFNVKYNLPFLYLTLKSSRDDFNVLDNFNVYTHYTFIAFSLSKFSVDDSSHFQT